MEIELRNIHKAFGSNEVLKGVDLKLKSGEVHALTITIVSVWPKSASTFAIELFNIPPFCIISASPLLHVNKAYRPALPAFVPKELRQHWQS